MLRSLSFAAVLCALLVSATQAQLSRETLPNSLPEIVSVYDSTATAEGSLFFSNFQFAGKQTGCYLIIAANDGTPIFYRAMAKSALDFRVQPNGWLTYADNATRKFYAMDSNYVVIDSFAAATGLMCTICVSYRTGMPSC
jgi:hypothetical protein